MAFANRRKKWRAFAPWRGSGVGILFVLLFLSDTAATVADPANPGRSSSVKGSANPMGAAPRCAEGEIRDFWDGHSPGRPAGFPQNTLGPLSNRETRTRPTLITAQKESSLATPASFFTYADLPPPTSPP